MKFGQREGVWGHMGYQVSSVCEIVLPQHLYVCLFFATFLLILEPIDYFLKSKEELEEVGGYGLGWEDRAAFSHNVDEF